MTAAIVAAISIAPSVSGAGERPADPKWSPSLEAIVSEPGELHLGLYVDGTQDGFMRLGWMRTGEVLEFYDRSMMASAEVYESMRGTMTMPDFTPRDIIIRFHQGSAILDLNVQYADGRFLGERSVTRPSAGTSHSGIDVPILNEDPVYFRVLTFLLPMALPQNIGAEASYTWFSPLAGGLSDIHIRAEDFVDVVTPKGATFSTIRYSIRGGSPENDVYVTVGDEPRIVRIDVLASPIVFYALDDPASE